MKRIIALSFCLVSFPWCQSLPGWFFNPPNDNQYYFGIGISQQYSVQNTAFSEARQQAALCIAQEIDINISGALADVSSGSIGLSKSYSHIEIDTLLLAKIKNNIIVLDSSLSQNEAVMLVALRKDLKKPNKNLKTFIKTKGLSQSKPKWILRSPEKKNHVYGVGYGVRYRSTMDSWANSAKQARLDLAMQKQTRLKSLLMNRTTNASSTIEMIEQKVNLRLKGSRIIERWYDERTSIYYTLIEYQIK